MSDEHLSQLTFDSLNIPESLKRGISDLKFTRCTPIQAQTLPEALAGHDVAGQAQTGTGKTAAFLVALFNRLLTEAPPPKRPANAPRAIVIAPTRELAVQIHSDAEGIGKYTGLKLAIVFGGVDYEKQRRVLEDGVDVVIGTPGRIIDYFKQGVFDLRYIQVAVMDEADRMFDLGFIKDIRFILRRLPHPTLRLNMLFSATLSHRVLELAYEHMNNPTLIRIEPDKMTVDRVRQVLYFPSTEEKIPLLMGLLRRIDAARTMVFVNTRRIAEVLERTLTANGFVAQALSGDVPQTKRLKMMRDFHNGDVAVLIATDVASRGLHIPDVSHDVQLRLTERCGRLRAPHRPDGACRRRGRCDQFRLRGVCDFPAGYRDVHRPSNSARGDRPRRPGSGHGSSACRVARTRAASPILGPRRWTSRRRRSLRGQRRRWPSGWRFALRGRRTSRLGRLGRPGRLGRWPQSQRRSGGSAGTDGTACGCRSRSQRRLR